MEGVPDVAYDEVKESHYRDDGLIFFTGMVPTNCAILRRFQVRAFRG